MLPCCRALEVLHPSFASQDEEKVASSLRTKPKLIYRDNELKKCFLNPICFMNTRLILFGSVIIPWRFKSSLFSFHFIIRLSKCKVIQS